MRHLSTPCGGDWRSRELGHFRQTTKQITHNNGYSYSLKPVRRSFWPWWRVGVLGGVGHGQACAKTSQFTEGGTNPTIGVVIRTHYAGIRAGCISLIRSRRAVYGRHAQIRARCNPSGCKVPRFDRNSRSCLTFVGGRSGGIYHYCAQSNEDEPSIPRACHWAGTELVFVRFQFRAAQRDAALLIASTTSGATSHERCSDLIQGIGVYVANKRTPYLPEWFTGAATLNS